MSSHAHGRVLRWLWSRLHLRRLFYLFGLHHGRRLMGCLDVLLRSMGVQAGIDAGMHDGGVV